MPKRCQITGKKPTAGNKVSHSMRHTKRRFLPNLFKKKIFNPLTGKYETMKISAHGLRNITKSPMKWFKKMSK